MLRRKYFLLFLKSWGQSFSSQEDGLMVSPGCSWPWPMESGRPVWWGLSSGDTGFSGLLPSPPLHLQGSVAPADWGQGSLSQGMLLAADTQIIFLGPVPIARVTGAKSSLSTPGVISKGQVRDLELQPSCWYTYEGLEWGSCVCYPASQSSDALLSCPLLPRIRTWFFPKSPPPCPPISGHQGELPCGSLSHSSIRSRARYLSGCCSATPGLLI